MARTAPSTPAPRAVNAASRPRWLARLLAGARPDQTPNLGFDRPQSAPALLPPAAGAPGRRRLLGRSILAALSGAGLAAAFLSPDPDWSDQTANLRSGPAQGDATVALPTAAREGHDGPTSPGTVAALQAAQQRSAELWREVARRRAELSARIGTRGATVATYTGLDGRAVPIHAVNVEQARKLFRRLPQSDRAAAVEAVRLGCARWDAHAEREGLLEMQHRAEAARRQADGLLRQVAVGATA